MTKTVFRPSQINNKTVFGYDVIVAGNAPTFPSAANQRFVYDTVSTYDFGATVTGALSYSVAGDAAFSINDSGVLSYDGTKVDPETFSVTITAWELAGQDGDSASTTIDVALVLGVAAVVDAGSVGWRTYASGTLRAAGILGVEGATWEFYDVPAGSSFVAEVGGLSSGYTPDANGTYTGLWRYWDGTNLILGSKEVVIAASGLDPVSTLQSQDSDAPTATLPAGSLTAGFVQHERSPYSADKTLPIATPTAGNMLCVFAFHRSATMGTPGANFTGETTPPTAREFVEHQIGSGTYRNAIASWSKVAEGNETEINITGWTGNICIEFYELSNVGAFVEYYTGKTTDNTSNEKVATADSATNLQDNNIRVGAAFIKKSSTLPTTLTEFEFDTLTSNTSYEDDTLSSGIHQMAGWIQDPSGGMKTETFTWEANTDGSVVMAATILAFAGASGGGSGSVAPEDTSQGHNTDLIVVGPDDAEVATNLRNTAGRGIGRGINLGI